MFVRECATTDANYSATVQWDNKLFFFFFTNMHIQTDSKVILILYFYVSPHTQTENTGFVSRGVVQGGSERCVHSLNQGSPTFYTQ